ncbi:hypothetical protein LOCC1_G002860 [Lachnellula occidentalis]|uniref:Fungal N-terminal domain-containing protein n=1 Tax=Lachnellula occidentalis TaxID=215460 RepID=A0A8H8S7Z7_9HELO|nr:hypothetical protein LOCC1_G002860 [Lachnellula occidentalis]
MSGLEVFGAVASVAQLAGVVYSISKQLYEVADAFSNAPSDIKDLAHDLEIFHEELVLHAQLVTEENARYSNQIIRLTSKIIGGCAEICIKIDKILKRLRSGSVWAKIKWIYKEKEIVKLLTRLKDLKLSLMRVLSLLTSAKADHMMNALGVTKPSVFEGAENAGLSEETIADIEKTRQKLAGISIGRSSPQIKVSVHSELEHAVTHQALNTTLGEQQPGQEVPQNDKTRMDAETTSWKETPQVATNDVWKQEMIQSAIKHFGMTREHAEFYVLTLPVPTTGTVSNKVQGGSNPMPVPDEHDERYLAEGNASLLSTPRRSPQRLPSDLRSGTGTGQKRNRRSPVSTRTNEYFIPENGINRDVITADINRYLGNDAQVRPGIHETAETGQVHRGYYITAYRPLTAAMIEDLEADSARWEQEGQGTASKEQSHNVAPATSALSSQYQHPTDFARVTGTYESQGYDSMYQYPEGGSSYGQAKITTNTLATSESSSRRRERKRESDRGYPYQQEYIIQSWQRDDDDVHYVPGANMVALSQSDPRINPRQTIPRTSYNGNDRMFISSDFGACHLWERAFFRLEKQSADITHELIARWRADGAWHLPLALNHP